MIRTDADVAVLGSGFGGSLTALILNQIGLKAILVERETHPRFTIGESSTPIANLILRDLCDRYDLPRLRPLTKYGSWQESYPEIGCGLKRGFSYFRHRPDQPFLPDDHHTNELLVTASERDAHSDTHWLRSDVDAFFADEVVAAGVQMLDATVLVGIDRIDDHWRLVGHQGTEPVHIVAKFVIDATGGAAELPFALSIPRDNSSLQTNSRAIFAHFENVKPWREILDELGASADDHPFECDRAALHHLLDEGWMWQLRFNNGICSAGLVLTDRAKGHDRPTAAEQWDQILDRYPSISEQFRDAKIVGPPGGLRATDRLQRQFSRVADRDFALLPNTAGFVDPLHSTGIAQTLSGIEKLASILEQSWKKPRMLTESLDNYERTVQSEIQLIDLLVSGCYSTMHDFRLFAACSMLYFAAATTYEHRRLNGNLEQSFLCADDINWRCVVRSLSRRATRLDPASLSDATVVDFEHEVAEAIKPFNTVGLCDPSARNMYRFTALPT